MKINDIVTESTTAGSIATVAAPMTTQSRNASIYGGKKGGNLLTGKKTNKKYANSVNESKMKELAMDIRNMDNGNFKKKYGKTKEHFKATLGDPDKKTVNEAFADGFEKYKIVYFDPKKDRTITSSLMAKDEESVWNKCAERGVEVVSIEKVPYKPRKLGEAQLEEDDVIIVPGQGRGRKTGFIKHGESRLDHEVEMARSDLFQAAKNAKQVYEMIADVSEEEGLEGWVQEKIIKANDYLNSVREYLEGKQLQEMTGGVIAGGEGNFEESSKPGLWANIHAKRERIKKGSGERMRKPGSKGAPSSQDFKDAANEGIVDKIKGAVRREKSKDMPLVQTRRDYAMGKGGEAYNKGEIRKGNQYMAYAEKDRKKKGDPTTNPAGTYRTKTTDYSTGDK